MNQPPLMGGAIVVDQNEIIDVGLEESMVQRYPHAQRENFEHHVIIPGLINAHTHLDMSLNKNFVQDPVRSVTGSVNYIQWVRSCIDYKKNCNPEQERDAVLEGLTQVIDSGTTCIGDMGSYEGVFNQIENAGLRAVIFPELISYDSYVAKDLFETAMALVEKYTEIDNDLIQVGAGPYSAYTLSRNILRIMAQYCRTSHLPLMIHVAESFAEVEFFYDSTGDIADQLFPIIGWGEDLPPAFRKTPIHYLYDIGFLDAQPLLVGCVHLTDQDQKRIAFKKAKVVWCPRSQKYLRLGRAPIADLLDKKITVALGTDGLSSNNNLSLWDEMRQALDDLQEIYDHDKLGHEIFRMVTTQAAKALGLENEVGELRAGFSADYAVVNISEYSGKGDLYRFLIEHTQNSSVQKSVVGGQTLKRMN